MKTVTLTESEKTLLRLLNENARQSTAILATKCKLRESEVEILIESLQKRGVIRQFTTVINESIIQGSFNKVKALIEVRINPEKSTGFETIARRIYEYKSVIDQYLISGTYDFLLIMEGDSIEEIGDFVFDKLATIGNVTGTTTHFILKKYKENGVIIPTQSEADRLAVIP